MIAKGDGSTYWDSVSSILEMSSFKTVKGNNTSTFSADLYNRTLTISTTGVEGILESYVDPRTSTLMLSNYLPPFLVARGSVPQVTLAAATNVPNSESLQQVTGQSTIKFLGLNDINFSTVTSQRAVFIGISSYTATGYSTISGETFAWRPTLYSTLSTTAGRPNFVSTLPFTVGTQGWSWGSNLTYSTPVGTEDIYFSTAIFQLDHIVPYMDFSQNSSTRLFVDYRPSLLFSTMRPGTTSLVKEMSTFIQYESPSLGRGVLPETTVTTYLTSQRSINDTTPFLSNSYDTPIQFNFNVYKSFYNTYVLNNSNTVNFAIYHRVVNAMMDVTNTNSGFSSASTFANLMSKTSGLFINLQNASPTLP